MIQAPSQSAHHGLTAVLWGASLTRMILTAGAPFLGLIVLRPETSIDVQEPVVGLVVKEPVVGN